MEKFNKCNLTDSKIKSWIDSNLNVMLIGKHGIGKTERILNAFKEHNINYQYFSGSTLDPYIDVIGMPEAVVDKESNEKYLEFIRPKNMNKNLEAIFLDEFNRSHKSVRNALLELLQFKSINGYKFPNLKMIWVAVNPPKDEEDADSQDFDVEELDPAQMDRFQIIVEVNDKPDESYFNNKYGKFKSKLAIDWYNKQSNKTKSFLSPRRLDYVIGCFEKGVDIKDMLPVSANVVELTKALSTDEKTALIEKVLNGENPDLIIEFIKTKDNFLKYKDKFSSEEFWRYYKHIHPELIQEKLLNNEKFKYFAIIKSIAGDKFYTKELKDYAENNPQDPIDKVITTLKSKNISTKTNEEITINSSSNGYFNEILNKSKFASNLNDNLSNLDNFNHIFTSYNVSRFTYNGSMFSPYFDTNDKRIVVRNLLVPYSSLIVELLKDPNKCTRSYPVINLGHIYDILIYMLAIIYRSQENTIKGIKGFREIFLSCLEVLNLDGFKSLLVGKSIDLKKAVIDLNDNSKQYKKLVGGANFPEEKVLNVINSALGGNSKPVKSTTSVITKEQEETIKNIYEIISLIST